MFTPETDNKNTRAEAAYFAN